MTVNDVLTLLNAGYTKEEINGMIGEDPQPVSAEPIQTAVPEPAAPAPAAAPQPQTENPELLEAIRTLTAAVQHNNVINTPQPAGVTQPDASAAADKLLTTFCNT